MCRVLYPPKIREDRAHNPPGMLILVLNRPKVSHVHLKVKASEQLEKIWSEGGGDSSRMCSEV